MSGALFGVTLFAALGAALNAGLFFIFSVCIMQALDRIPAAAGAAAMQSINRVILNPLFLLAFMGTALASAGLAVAALFRWDEPDAKYMLAGSVVYLVGVTFLTSGYHVPRNNALDAVDADSAEGQELWKRYVPDWTRWNHVRTLASLAATACFILALYESAS
jgi:uncharacterized membrane protein